MSQQGKGKLKVCWTSIHNKKLKVFLVLYSHSQFLCSLARFDLAIRGAVRQSSRTLSMLDCSYSTRHQRSLILQL